METGFFRESSGGSGGFNYILSGMFDLAGDFFDFFVDFRTGFRGDLEDVYL